MSGRRQLWLTPEEFFGRLASEPRFVGCAWVPHKKVRDSESKNMVCACPNVVNRFTEKNPLKWRCHVDVNAKPAKHGQGRIHILKSQLEAKGVLHPRHAPQNENNYNYERSIALYTARRRDDANRSSRGEEKVGGGEAKSGVNVTSILENHLLKPLCSVVVSFLRPLDAYSFAIQLQDHTEPFGFARRRAWVRSLDGSDIWLAIHPADAPLINALTLAPGPKFCWVRGFQTTSYYLLETDKTFIFI